MKAVIRIPTRRSIPRRIFRAISRSQWPAVVIYAAVFMLVIVANLLK